MRYAFNVLVLLMQRRISLATFRYALRERPVAVAGRNGGHIVDPDFE